METIFKKAPLRALGSSLLLCLQSVLLGDGTIPMDERQFVMDTIANMTQS